MKLARSRKELVSGVVISLFLWVVLLFAWTQQQAIADWWRLRDYTPPPEIVALADATTMTDKARHIFYVYHPRLEYADSFNGHCRQGNEFTIVLGCYVSGQGIYVFAVDDERLAGIEEVTAAHEMLHAAYDRLSDEERAQIDRLTAKTYDSLSNERIKKTISEYAAQDKSSVAPELYSILGTEVYTLPSQLEAHYKQYFKDRHSVVALAEAYEQAFREREEKINALTQSLSSYKKQIERKSSELNKESAELESEYARLQNSRRSDENFRQAAQRYNQRVDAYNAEARTLSNLIDAYNETYAVYKQLVTEQEDLFEAIDSRPKTLQAQ